MEMLQMRFIGCCVWFGLSILPSSKYTRKGEMVDGGDRYEDYSMTFYPTFIVLTIVLFNLFIIVSDN